MKTNHRSKHRYAFSLTNDGEVQYVGRVTSRGADFVEINAWDALSLLLIGETNETGELMRLPSHRCRVFASKDALADAYRQTRRITEHLRDTSEAASLNHLSSTAAYPLHRAVTPDNSWNVEALRHKVVCPVCGYHYSHPASPTHSVDRTWLGRGHVTAVRFDGECGHAWEVCFGFHKGEVFAFCRSVSSTEDDAEVAAVDSLLE